MAKRYIKEMLQRYSDMDAARYHMPGHKGRLNSFDVTEISRTDNLNNPEDNILDAQRSLGKSYGSAHSFFMVNGSTGGIQVMIKYTGVVSTFPILISRNSHKSIFSSCALFGIDTIIIDDKYDDNLQAFIFDEQKVKDAITQNNLSAVVITAVDYFGRVIDVSGIAELCRQKDVLLLCDEAHGAHLHISDMLPASSLSYADMCVHSPHKTLSALTQCAYIHISDKIDTDKFKSVMRSLQTTSPSFLLMEAMDNARYDADAMKKPWEIRVREVAALSERVNKINGIRVMDKTWALQTGYSDRDITRLVIDVSEIDSGIEIGKILEDKYGVFMEMYSFKYIVGIMTPWDDTQWDERLYEALNEIVQIKAVREEMPQYPDIYEKAISMQHAAKADWVKTKLEQAAGRISAESIGVYPPGVPLVLPGEIISRDVIDYMGESLRLGGGLFGVTLGYVNCVKEKQIIDT